MSMKPEETLPYSSPKGAPERTLPAAPEGVLPPVTGEEIPPEAGERQWNVGDIILGLYEVKDVHESGGMGLVYRVTHRGWNRDLALKLPRAGLFQTEEQKENFIREAETWVELGLYPNIVSCYYVRDLGGRPGIFAEYVEGGSLEDWIEEQTLYEGGARAALERILDISIQFARGLHYSHEKGLVRQDVKPANTLMTPGGEAKVTDFGLARARALTGEKRGAWPGMSMLVSAGGMTPAYCSPEQARGEGLSRKTDIWSWALSVLAMFNCGATWMNGAAAPQLLENYRRMGAGVEFELPVMPDEILALLERCFSPEPGDRPGSMGVIADLLEEVYRKITGSVYRRQKPEEAALLADGLNNRAVSFLDLGRMDEALALWDEALCLESLHVQSNYNKRAVLWRAARIDDGQFLREMEEIYREHPKNGDYYYVTGLIHLERDECESAVKCLAEACEKSGGNVEVKAALARAESRKERNRRCVGTLNEQGFVESACFSPDGRWVLSGGAEGLVKLWDLSTGECARVLKGEDEPGDGVEQVNSVSFSPDGRMALSGHADTTVRLWDLATGAVAGAFRGHGDSVTSVCFSHDGKWALSGSADTTLIIWDIMTGKCEKIFKGHRVAVASAAMSPDGRFVLSGSDELSGKPGELKFWDIESGQCLRTLEGHSGGVKSVCFSSDRNLGHCI
jgi:serine/threonine protein kinase